MSTLVHATTLSELPRREAAPRVEGARLSAALGFWIAGSVLSALVTIFVGRAIAPAWAANTNELTTVITFEVYAILVAALVIAFPGRRRVAALRLQGAPWRTYLLAFGAVAGMTALATLGFVLTGQGDVVRSTYHFIGTDGGSLGLIGPITVVFSIGRACILAPIGEELLFRGAIYGWSRRWLGPRLAILFNAALFGVTAAAAGTIFFVVYSFLLGVALNVIRERSGSTRPGIAVHIVHNTAIVLVVFLLTSR